MQQLELILKVLWGSASGKSQRELRLLTSQTKVVGTTKNSTRECTSLAPQPMANQTGAPKFKPSLLSLQRRGHRFAAEAAGACCGGVCPLPRSSSRCPSPFPCPVSYPKKDSAAASSPAFPVANQCVGRKWSRVPCVPLSVGRVVIRESAGRVASNFPSGRVVRELAGAAVDLHLQYKTPVDARSSATLFSFPRAVREGHAFVTPLSPSAIPLLFRASALRFSRKGHPFSALAPFSGPPTSK